MLEPDMFLRGEEVTQMKSLVNEIDFANRILNRGAQQELDRLSQINQVRKNKWQTWKNNNPSAYQQTMNKLSQDIKVEALKLAKEKITGDIITNILSKILGQVDTFYLQLSIGENFMIWQPASSLGHPGTISFTKNRTEILLLEQFVPEEPVMVPVKQEHSIFDYFTKTIDNPPMPQTEPKVYSASKLQLEYLKETIKDYYKINGYRYFELECSKTIFEVFTSTLPI